MSTYRAAVITISDKGFAGERTDTSGPALCRMLEAEDFEIIRTAILPDDKDMIKKELISCADHLGADLILTTGGTGFSQRDITPEAAEEVIERKTPGLPELMRSESLKITPRGCLSRGTAGIRGSSLIITLPGSEKAARENLTAILPCLSHGLDMLKTEGSANCAGETVSHQAEGPGPNAPSDLLTETLPSVDEWLREAKALETAGKIGMFLIHNGIVRETSRNTARNGVDEAPVRGMDFSYDKEKALAAIDSALKMPGISHVRVYLAKGTLRVGDDIMYVLIGGDIRPHVIEALTTLVGTLKNECVTERELS